MRALPAFSRTARISAKSMLPITPGVVIRSEIPSTACFSISSHIMNACLAVVSFETVESSRSFGITMIASTDFRSSSIPASARRTRDAPSNENGLVTTPIVSMPSSLAVEATTGAAPVPVPPPSPPAINTMSAPLIASWISSLVSSAARLPTSGFIPAPRPFVRFLPI